MFLFLAVFIGIDVAKLLFFLEITNFLNKNCEFFTTLCYLCTQYGKKKNENNLFRSSCCAGLRGSGM